MDTLTYYGYTYCCHHRRNRRKGAALYEFIWLCYKSALRYLLWPHLLWLGLPWLYSLSQVLRLRSASLLELPWFQQAVEP